MGLSTLKSGKMLAWKSFCPWYTDQLNYHVDKALAWGGTSPTRSAFFVLRRQFAAPPGPVLAASPLYGFELC
jgi:hypothetical protein